MLESVKLTNFRCFRSAEVRLGPLTALVGPNASGKSALLDAISFHGVRKNHRDVWQQEPGLSARIDWVFHDASRFVEFGAKKQKEGSPPKGQYIHLDVRSMRKHVALQEQTRLSADGSNLTNVVATLPRRQQDRLARDLSSLVPVLQDVTPTPSQQGHHRLLFQDRWNEDVWYEPEEVSDGSMLALGLLTLAHQKEPLDLVAIEEPEHGLHPYLLGEIVAVLRKLANGEVGRRPVQIVLATQSSELLEFLEPNEVRFLSRTPDDGSVTIEEPPTGTDDWRQAYAAHQESLGSLWLAGGMGGVPGS